MLKQIDFHFVWTKLWYPPRKSLIFGHMTLRKGLNQQFLQRKTLTNRVFSEQFCSCFNYKQLNTNSTIHAINITVVQGAYGVGKTRKSREFENLIFLTWKCREFGSSVWKSQGFNNISYILFFLLPKSIFS